MPITLDLCNTTPVGLRRDTFVDAGCPDELFVSAAMEETQNLQASMKGGQRTPGAIVISSQKSVISDMPAYSETLLAYGLRTTGDVEEIHKRPSGLIHALEAAYSNHRHLVLRPDDVWHAILTQFSIYVNKNSEKLRGSFVSHEGQKTFVVRS